MEAEMRISRLAVAAALCALLLGSLTTRASAACVRHNNVTALAIAGELTSVYANCNPPPPPPSCPPRYGYGQSEIKNIDGYTNWSNWVWSGLSTTTFSTSQQDALIATGISKANAVAPPGKTLIKLVFFMDIITSQPVEYVVGEHATYAKCVPLIIKMQTKANPSQ